MQIEKTLIQKILSNKLFPVALFTLNIYMFFYVIPNNILEEYQILFAILGGIITLILSFWCVFALIPKVFDSAPILFGILCISSLFIFGYFLITKTSHFATQELIENGVLTEGIIVDKSQFYGKRGSTVQDIDVSFKTQDGIQRISTISITPSMYDTYYKGMRIPIYYSSKYPDISEIAFDKLNN